MPAETFVSTYKGIKYKVPKTGKIAVFDDGRLTTEDKDTIDYLKGHKDFGANLTTANIPAAKPRLAVGLHMCPFCQSAIADDDEYIKHLEAHVAEGRRTPEAGPAARALQTAHAMRLEQAAAAEGGKAEKAENLGKK